MNWLGGVFFKALIEWVWSKLSALIQAYYKAREQHKKAENQAALDSEAAKHANANPEKVTSDETDKAIDEQFKHI